MKLVPSDVIVTYAEENVLGLNVGVDDLARLMHVLEALESLADNRLHAFHRQAPVIRLKNHSKTSKGQKQTFMIHLRRWWPRTSKTMTTWVPLTP